MSGEARAVALDGDPPGHRGGGLLEPGVPGAAAAIGLDGRDRDLATELAYGTLRRTAALDDAIDRFADRPVDADDARTRGRCCGSARISSLDDADARARGRVRDGGPGRGGGSAGS